MKDTTRQLLDALKVKTGCDVMHGKGGFWIEGQGFVSIAQARKLTGVDAPTRNTRPRVAPWGDYATIAMLNSARKV